MRLFYLADRDLLIITIPTRSHEVLHVGFQNLLIVSLALMGVDTQWIPLGATRLSRGGGSGEGDSSGGPWDTRGGAESWPTLVIEAGVSQSGPSLRLKMRWWFAASEAQVSYIFVLHEFSSDKRTR